MPARARPGRPERPGAGRSSPFAALATALFVVGSALAATGLAGCESPTQPAGHVLVVDDQGRNEVLRAFAPDLGVSMPAATLLTPAGNPYPLRAKTAGKVALVYFGYTHCPDVCPATMATMAQAVEDMPAAVRDKVMIVFISVDPERDTGDVLLGWVRLIDRRIVALRGTTEQVRGVAQAMRADLGTADPLDDGGYTLSHSSNVTAFTPDGVARAVYPTTATIPDWEHDLPILARTGSAP